MQPNSGYPGEPHPNLWSMGLNGQNLTSCLSPLLILNYPENKNKSSLLLGDHQGALLLVSHCSYPDALSVAWGTVANPLLHPALHTPASFGQLVPISPFPLGLDSASIQTEYSEAPVPAVQLCI